MDTKEIIKAVLGLIAVIIQLSELLLNKDISKSYRYDLPVIAILWICYFID